MSKMCWKCGKYHDDGADTCPFCGASFTSGSDRYESDGRTISNRDDTAYLKFPPPKYKRPHVILPVVIIAALIIATVFVVAQGSMSDNSPDVRYNYAMYTVNELPTDTGSIPADEGMQFVILKIAIVNDRLSSGVSSDILVWQFSLFCNGNLYKMDESKTRLYVNYHAPVIVQKGEMTVFYEVFQVPSGSSITDIPLDYHGDGKVSRDSRVPVI